jgi:hypothetical protein
MNRCGLLSSVRASVPDCANAFAIAFADAND